MEKRSGGRSKRRGSYQWGIRGNGKERNRGGRRGGHIGGNVYGERSSEGISGHWGEESEDANEEKYSECENESKSRRESPCPDENEVFEYFIKAGGPSSFTNIAKGNLFPKDFDISGWFYSHRRRFILFENKDKVHFIVPFYKQATFCLDYNGLGKKKLCDKSDCRHAHVCKNFIGGSCKEGRNCQFSHDFFDRANSSLVYKLGLNMFNNDEIRLIYSHRYPHVCYKHTFERICLRPVCAYLHICCDFLLGKCKEESTCPWVHNLRTNQNQYVLTAYHMAHLEEHLVKKMIFASCSSTSELNTARSNPDVGETKPKEKGPINGSIDDDCNATKELVLEMDTAQSIPICHSYIVGECKTAGCIYLHIDSIQLPYIWQIWISDKWQTIDKSQMSKVEEDYCNKRSDCPIMISYGGSNCIALFLFETTDMMTALITTMGQDSSSAVLTKVRRLSTGSYAEGTKLSAEASFQTQYRWFFHDESGSWSLFDPELLQFTLEQKYTRKCQETYLLFRDNYHFKYRVNFKLMKQTNMDTGKERKLLRRPLFVSPDDVKSRNYPATISIPTGAKTRVPRDWVPWDLAHKFELVELERDSSEFKTVENSFFTTLHRNQFHINYICRVQNMDLWTAYHGQKKSMKGDLERVGQTKKVDERSLFHGTDSLDSVRGICTNCFDFRVSGKNATVYGKGAYFASDARYSHKYTKPSKRRKERHMFLAKVLVGEYAIGSSSYTRPPEKPGGTSHQLFDSCVDSIINPSIFVVFDFKQCYPEYLICYKMSEEQLPEREATTSLPTNNATPTNTSHLQPSKSQYQSHVQSTQSTSSPQRTTFSGITFHVTASPAPHQGSESTISRPSSHTVNPPSVAPITLNTSSRGSTSVRPNNNATSSHAFQLEPKKSQYRPKQSHIQFTHSTSSPQEASSNAAAFNVTAATAPHQGSDSAISLPSSYTVNPPSVSPVNLNTTRDDVSYKINSRTSSSDSADDTKSSPKQPSLSLRNMSSSKGSKCTVQ